jgi:hypothetical protein
VVENGNSFPETKTISTENGSVIETQDKDVVMEGLGSVAVYDQWIAPPISGQRPKARYEVLACCFYISELVPGLFLFSLNKGLVKYFQHGAAVVQDKMYIYGGNHNGRYLNDIHVRKFSAHIYFFLIGKKNFIKKSQCVHKLCTKRPNSYKMEGESETDIEFKETIKSATQLAVEKPQTLDFLHIYMYIDDLMLYRNDISQVVLFLGLLPRDCLVGYCQFVLFWFSFNNLLLIQRKKEEVKELFLGLILCFYDSELCFLFSCVLIL